MTLLMALACSDYALEGKDTRAPPPRDSAAEDSAAEDSAVEDSAVEDSAVDDSASDDTAEPPPEEICDGLDNDGDGETDEGFDANGDGVVDCLEPDEEAYCTPFDDFGGWAYTGNGEWYVESGLLTEGRSGTYAAIAYTADMGPADTFLIQVDTAWGGSLNDLVGIAWGVAGDVAYVARWDDPQGDYGRYSPTGGMDLSRCDSGGCTVLAADSAADLGWPADGTFATWSVAVDGADVEVVVNGAVVLAATVPELVGTGAGVVGVYSNDNDGGVWFDDFCVWVGG